MPICLVSASRLPWSLAAELVRRSRLHSVLWSSKFTYSVWEKIEPRENLHYEKVR